MLRDLFSLFPAYAGVILGHGGFTEADFSFPRIRGGDPQFGIFMDDLKAFSPHTRG